MTSPRRGTPDFLLLFLTLALVAFGLMMVYSSSSMVSTFKYDNSFIFAKKQAVAVGLGAVGMLFFMNVPYSKLKKWTLPLFAIVLLLLVLVLFFGNGDTQYGARSWIDLGPFNLQPAEFAKLAVILYLANLIRKKGTRCTTLKRPDPLPGDNRYPGFPDYAAA
ncbi:FtsW/RodA/SpoVE family cell cycle protein [Paenibacillus sp. CC-CFT747]|nr:FtsW/RodA/SpoVE family cell cycle protein [Paenibacillus sp. CC-CFT747]